MNKEQEIKEIEEQLTSMRNFGMINSPTYVELTEMRDKLNE